MRIAILALGTRGDVQPYVALGLGLRAAGHDVTLATFRVFETLVRGRGLTFAPVAGDPYQALRTKAGQELLTKGGPFLLQVVRGLRVVGPLYARGAVDCWRASGDADAIVVNANCSWIGYHLAERRGVPLVKAHHFPHSPTRSYPLLPALAPLGRSLGPLEGSFNLWTHRLARQLYWLLARGRINSARRRALDLPPLGWRFPFDQIGGQPCPILYGCSPAVWPPPPDWDDWIHVTGYWFLDRPAGWQPPPGLVAFLESGPPPVYVGFGMMNAQASDDTTRLVLRALQLAGQRGVLLTSAGEPNGGGPSAEGQTGGVPRPDQVFPVRDVPFDWLFPRLSAVVHHSGAGTTAAALRAGVPSVCIADLGDQPFWARRVHALGAGPAPLSGRQLTAEKLAAAVRLATGDQRMRQRASALGALIRAEDGVGRAVEILERYVAGRSRALR